VGFAVISGAISMLPTNATSDASAEGIWRSAMLNAGCDASVIGYGPNKRKSQSASKRTHEDSWVNGRLV
jgi:hypothetical protein